MSKTSPAFSVDRVSFRYQHSATAGTARTEAPIFEDLTVTITPGQMLGIIGPNGSGKSTLLKLLAGIVHPQKGAVSLFEDDLRTISPDAAGRILAYIPQECEIAFPFTVQDIVLMGRYPHSQDHLWDLWGWESNGDYAAAERAMCERHVASGFPVSIVRPAAIYGPRNNIFDMETPMFLRLLHGRPVLLPHAGLVTASYGHVDDLCELLVHMTGSPAAIGEVFNITAEAVTTRR